MNKSRMSEGGEHDDTSHQRYDGIENGQTEAISDEGTMKAIVAGESYETTVSDAQRHERLRQSVHPYLFD